MTNPGQVLPKFTQGVNEFTGTPYRTWVRGFVAGVVMVVVVVCAVLEYWQACSVDEKGRYLGRKEEQENSAGRDSACVVGSSHYSDKVTRTP